MIPMKFKNGDIIYSDKYFKNSNDWFIIEIIDVDVNQCKVIQTGYNLSYKKNYIGKCHSISYNISGFWKLHKDLTRLQKLEGLEDL